MFLEIKQAGKRRKLYNLLMSNHYSAREPTTTFTTRPLYCSRHKNTWTKPTAKTRMVHNLGWVITKRGTNSYDNDHLKFLGVWWSKDEHIDPNGKDKVMSWLHQENHTNKPSQMLDLFISSNFLNKQLNTTEFSHYFLFTNFIFSYFSFPSTCD